MTCAACGHEDRPLKDGVCAGGCRCGDCDAPITWDEATQWWRHTDPATPPCFLLPGVDDLEDLRARAMEALRLQRQVDNLRGYRAHRRLRLGIVGLIRQRAEESNGAARDRALDLAATLEAAR